MSTWSRRSCTPQLYNSSIAYCAGSELRYNTAVSKNRKSAYIHCTPFLFLSFVVSAAADPVIISGGPANDYESWIIRANDSRLMVIFCRNPDWQSGDLYATFSADNGVSWDVPIAIVESPGDQATLSFLQLPGDTFRLWYASNENTNYGIYTAHSLNGIVWNRDGRVKLGWQVYDMHYDPTVIIEPDSSLTMSYRGPGGAYIAHRPYGGVWDTTRTLVGPSGYRPRVMKHSDGTYLFAYHRNTGSGYEVFVRTSIDRINWMAECRLTDDGNSHDPFPNITTDGAYLIYYATYLPPAYNLYRRLSYDAVNWGPEEQVTFDATNNTQPHFFAESNEIFLVWAHAVLFPDDHDVYFEKFDYTGISCAGGVQTPENHGSIDVFPIPCSHRILVVMPITGQAVTDFTIYDIQGRVVRQPRSVECRGSNVLAISTNQLSTGVYFLQVHGAAVTHHARFIVAR